MDQTIAFTKATTESMKEFPSKSQQIAALIAMKLRHRDVLEELSEQKVASADSWAWKKHLSHSVKPDRGMDQVMVNADGY